MLPNESVRTSLYAICVIGIAFLLFFWIGACGTISSLRHVEEIDANKRSRMNTIFAVAFVFQVICILSLFGVVNIPAIASLTGISGLISLICVIVFIATADDAYLSCFGDEGLAGTPRYLRGICLGHMLGGAFYFPLLAWYGMYRVTSNLFTIYQNDARYHEINVFKVKTAAIVCGVLHFILLILLIVFCVVTPENQKASYVALEPRWIVLWWFGSWLASIIFLAVADGVILRMIFVQDGGGVISVSNDLHTTVTAPCPSCRTELSYQPNKDGKA